MKRKLLYISTIILTVLAVSCSDFLDKQPITDYTSKTFYTNETNVMRALTGSYNAISFNSANNRIWVFGDVASDDSQKGGNPGDLVDAGAIDEFDIKPTNGVLNEYWKFAYEAVNRTNCLIAYAPDVKMDDTKKARVIGEAKFIRAYTYFNLVNVWGRIPLRVEVATLQSFDKPLSDVSVVYTQIESDLNAAINSPIANTYTGNDAGRVTKGAAHALLAKVYLYQKKYAECIAEIAKLDALGVYGLETNYADLFKSGAENSVETIFAIRHLNAQNPGMGNILNVYFAPSLENGYYMNSPTDSYVAAFDEQTTAATDDPRLDASIGRAGKPWLNGNNFDAAWSATGYLVKKHNQPLSEVSMGTKSDGNLPYIYIRYADILLMKAEAMNERNTGTDFADAKTALQQVRTRANLANTTAANQIQLREAIQKERRRELGFEFHRFFDLMRWGKDVATQALDPNFKWAEPRYYFPIPSGEIDTNKAL